MSIEFICNPSSVEEDRLFIKSDREVSQVLQKSAIKYLDVGDDWEIRKTPVDLFSISGIDDLESRKTPAGCRICFEAMTD